MSKNDSPSKPQRILVEQESLATIAVSTPAFLSLAKRAGKSKYPLTVLEQVYCRGLLASKYHPKNTPEQQAFQRVDSFIHEGRAYELDHDLVCETPVVPNGKKHMHIIKNAIKHHEERNKPEEPTEEPIKEGDPLLRIAAIAGRGARNLVSGGRRPPGQVREPKESSARKKIKQEKYQAREIERYGGKVLSRQKRITLRHASKLVAHRQVGQLTPTPTPKNISEPQAAAAETRALAKTKSLNLNPIHKAAAKVAAYAQEQGLTNQRVGPWGGYKIVKKPYEQPINPPRQASTTSVPTTRKNKKINP